VLSAFGAMAEPAAPILSTGLLAIPTLMARLRATQPRVFLASLVILRLVIGPRWGSEESQRGCDGQAGSGYPFAPSDQHHLSPLAVLLLDTFVQIVPLIGISVRTRAVLPYFLRSFRVLGSESGRIGPILTNVYTLW
jgi:hypothetical protein